MNSELAFILLFCVATAVALLVRHFRIPYTVALVLAGLGLGALRWIDAPHLTQELLFAVFLPGLLFEAAYHIRWHRLRENARVILALAVPGVVAAIGVTGVITAWIVRGLEVDPTFMLSQGLVFGALIAATDPIAVVALFRTLHVPSRLSLLVEGESLLNDGTAIVLFALILATVTGGTTTVSALTAQFLSTTAGGALIGVAVGLAASHVTKRVDEPTIEITLTVIAAYGAFVAAEQVHASGVIATVASGLVCGNVGRDEGMSPTTLLAVESFWEYLAFALNSIVFLLIGFEVSLGGLASYWREIAVATVAMLVARFFVVAAVTVLLRRTNEAVPRGWTTVLAWGGIRGGLSIVLALGLPRDLPHREQLITMTLGVVLSSILLQGMTMAPLLRRLGLVRKNEDHIALERARAEVRVATGALQEIDQLKARHVVSDGDAEAFRAPYRHRLDAARQAIDTLGRQAGAMERDRHAALRHLLALEARLVGEGYRADEISSEVHEELTREVAGRRIQLETHGVEALPRPHGSASPEPGGPPRREV